MPFFICYSDRRQLGHLEQHCAIELSVMMKFSICVLPSMETTSHGCFGGHLGCSQCDQGMEF